jgi:excinuclease ABC subunit C
MVASALDDVPGLGQTRRKALLRHFGSLAKLREASAEQIAEIPGIGAKTAAAVVAALAATAPGTAAAPLPAVDPTTGEIIEAGGVAGPVTARPSPDAAPDAATETRPAAPTLTPQGE